jgi:hypothetical protein
MGLLPDWVCRVYVGDWPKELILTTQGMGGSSWLLLPGSVAVLCCCIGSPPGSLLVDDTMRANRYNCAHTSRVS